MKLEPLMTMRAQLGEPYAIGAMGRGVRSIGVVVDGSFEGPRLRGKVVPPGADWIVFGDEGMGQLDVRITLVTDDGANIYMYYTGVLEMNDAMSGAFADGGETQFGDNYFISQPRFESGSEQYAWLNNTVAVGEGRAIAGGVEYRVYQCIPGD